MHGYRQEIKMNQDRLSGFWKQFKGQTKERWGKLINNPLLVIAGARDQFAGRIQKRYGVSKEEAERQLKDFFDRNRNWDLLEPRKFRPPQGRSNISGRVLGRPILVKSGHL